MIFKDILINAQRETESAKESNDFAGDIYSSFKNEDGLFSKLTVYTDDYVIQHLNQLILLVSKEISESDTILSNREFAEYLLCALSLCIVKTNVFIEDGYDDIILCGDEHSKIIAELHDIRYKLRELNKVIFEKFIM